MNENNKMNRETAAKIFKIPLDSERDVIMERYSIILKRFKGNFEYKPEGYDRPVTPEEVNTAFNILMDIEMETDTEKIKDPEVKKQMIKNNKIDNFFYYNKWKILIGGFFAIFVIFFIYTIATKPTPDLNIAVFGNFYCENADEFKNMVDISVEGISESSIDMIQISDYINSQMSASGRIKALARLSAKDVDIFICDRENFEIIAVQGAFEDLSIILGEGYAEKESDGRIKTNDGNEGLYGIDVAESQLLKKCGLLGNSYYVSLVVTAPNREKAIAFVKKVIE